MDLRTGDVVRLNCEKRQVRVVDVSGEYFSVEMPWVRADPLSEYGGDVAYAFPRSPVSPEWGMTPFRFDEDTTLLAVGDEVSISVPEMIAYITSIDYYDPPLDTGTLPRPEVGINLLHYGTVRDPEDEEQGFSYNMPGDDFIHIEIIFRPYKFLVDGDIVIDDNNTRLKFTPPWHFIRDGESRDTPPRWPLTLVEGFEQKISNRNATVQNSTSTGSHEAELAKWSRFSGVGADTL
jgi:hypothetical protein